MRDVRWNLIRRNERFETLADLQTTSDRRVRESAERLRCPLTGQTVAESCWLERPHSAPLPETLPTPFDTQVQRPVGRDGLGALRRPRIRPALRLCGPRRAGARLAPPPSRSTSRIAV